MGQYVYAQELSYEEVLFQDTPALFTTLRVKESSVPKGLHRYEFREEDGQPCQLARDILVNHYGTLLACDPIQLPADGFLSFEPEALAFPDEEMTTLEDFQRRHPSKGRDVMELFIAKPEEKPLFFSWSDGRDVTNGCIGHMRGDFVRDILHNTWWPHYWDTQCNDAVFKVDLKRVVDWLRVGFAPMKNLEIMDAFCAHYAQAAISGEQCTYGFRIETNRYRYMLRCIPVKGTYNVYLYCYGKGVAG